MSVLGIFAALALTTALGDPMPAPATVATPASAGTPMADGEVQVCKSVAVTGTRFGSRICHSKREWADMSVAARDLVNRSIEKSTVCGNNNNCR